MIKLLGVINSDKVNKYNIKFTISSLESAYRENWKWGVPSFLSHDYLKPIAWSRVRALHFEPGMVRTANITFVPENDAERELIGRQINQYYLEKTDKFISPYKKILLERLDSYLTSDYKLCATESAAIIDKDIAIKVFPEVFKTDDKHGLISLSKLNPIAPGIFEKDGLILYASPLFRRSFSRLNTLNSPFLDRFQKISMTKELNSKIALDKDMIGLSDSLHKVFEFQYWWGPLFTEKLDEIPTGVTVYNNKEKGKLFTDIESTEFWWYEQDERKTFESEEVITRPSLGINDSTYGCRFVHSILDQSSNEPIHLDGAVRMYDEEKIIKRWDVDISNSGRETDYNKIWRLDGNLKISEWKELISHYYRDNMLVGEYFGGKDKLKNFIPEYIEQEINSLPLSQYVPSHMEKGDGIRIALSYNEKSSSQTGRKIRAIESLEINNTKIKYVEADTIEVIKRLKERGEDLKLPPNTKLIAFEDMIINFPLFLHRGNHSVDDANATLEVIHELCASWSARRDDRVISFNIGIEYGSKEVTFSFAGHIEDFIEWLSFSGSKFPLQESQIGDWCEVTANFLGSKFPEARDRPKLGEMLNNSGMLSFERRFISSQNYKIYLNEKNKAVEVELKIQRSESELVEVITKGDLQVAPVFLVNKSTCSKCGAEYRLCACSKYVEQDVFENMQEVQGLGIFWTKRKA